MGELALPEVKPRHDGLTNKLLATLPASELGRLVPFLEPVTLIRGAELTRSKESDHFVYFPESAVISHYYLLRNGGTTAAAVIGNDGVVSLSTMFESRPPLYSTSVMIGGQALRVKAEVIRQEFARGESFQRLILAYMSKRLSQVSQRAVCNGRHKLAERLRTWLLMIDDRAEFVTRSRLPDEQIELVVAKNWTDAVREAIGNGKGVAIAVVTRGHSEDEECMQAICKVTVDYVGLIGSKRRTSIVIENLRRAGFADEQLKTIRAPIGLDIGAVSPEEVALAIIAEIVAERHGRKGESLSAWRRGTQTGTGVIRRETFD